MKTSIEHIIEPAHLMYHLVRGHPKFNGTELDAMIFAALCSFADPMGMIQITEKDRQFLEKGLQVSPQQMSNTITRLMNMGYLYATKHKGRYDLSPQMIDLVGAKLKKIFTVKFKANESALITQSTSIDIRDVEGDDT